MQRAEEKTVAAAAFTAILKSAEILRQEAEDLAFFIIHPLKKYYLNKTI